MTNNNIATEIVSKLNANGAAIGNVSVFIIQKVLDFHFPEHLPRSIVPAKIEIDKKEIIYDPNTMKDIIYEPNPELSNSFIINVLKEEITTYKTTHVMGVPIHLLIKEMEAGKNFGQAVTELRKIHSGKYHIANLSNNWRL